MTKIQKTKLNFRHFQLCLKFNNLKCEKKIIQQILKDYRKKKGL